MRLLSFLSALLLTSSAFATSILTSQTELLPTVEVNGQPTDLTGLLKLDFVSNEIQVQIYNDPCGHFQPPQPGVARCMAMPRLVTTLTVPLQERTSSCGSNYYTGLKDQTRVDGPRTTIKVADHQYRVCADVLSNSVMVEAESYNPWKNETTRYLLSK